MELAKNLKIDSVSRLHPTPPWQLAPGQTVVEAVALMRRGTSRVRAGVRGATGRGYLHGTRFDAPGPGCWETLDLAHF